MVYFDLIVRIISENITETRINGPCFEWYFNITCTHCKTEQPNEIYFTLKDEIELPSGHGTTNFVMSCKECKRSMTIKIYEKSSFKINCESGNSEETLATFDCRGCELVKWIPREGIEVEAIDTGKVFENVNIMDVWCDYDENAQVTCSILEQVQYKIEKNKNL